MSGERGEDKECPWSFRWGRAPGPVIEMRCLKPAGHGDLGNDPHEGEYGPVPTKIQWHAGDRRAFLGESPGACERQPGGCVLPGGHPGRCEK